MPREMMFAEAIAVAITEEMQRDANVVFYGQNMAMTDRDPFVRKIRQGSRAHHANLRNGRAGHRHRRGDDRACGRSSSCTWANSCSWRSMK